MYKYIRISLFTIDAHVANKRLTHKEKIEIFRDSFLTDCEQYIRIHVGIWKRYKTMIDSRQ